MKRGRTILYRTITTLGLLLLPFCEGLADGLFPIPKSRSTLTGTERQRIRYLNSTLIQKAHQYIAREENDEAQAALEQVLANDPGNNHARVMLLRLYTSQGDLARALEQADDLLTHYPDYLDLYLERAWVHGESGHWSAAIADITLFLTRAPHAHPARPLARANRAEYLFQSGDYAAAMEVAQEWLAERDTYDHRLFVAECALKLGHTDTALDALTAALALTQDDIARSALELRRGHLLYELNRLPEADAAFAVAESSLTDPETLHDIAAQRGHLAYRQAQYDQASAHYARALHHSFDEDIARSLLDTHQAARQWQPALLVAQESLAQRSVSDAFRNEVIERVMHIHGERGVFQPAYRAAMLLHKRTGDPQRLQQAAVAAQRAGLTEQAVRAYRQYLNEVYDPAAILDLHYLLRARAPMPRGHDDLSASRTWLERLANDADADPSKRQAARYELAQLYRESGDGERYRDLMESLTGDTSDGRFLYEFASHLYGTQQFERAIPLLIDAYPLLDDPALRYTTCFMLGDMLLLTGEPDEAYRWLERAPEHAEPDRLWHLAMARANYQRHLFDAAIEQLLPIAGDDDLFHLYIAFSFYNRSPSMPGLALYHLNRVREPEQLDEDERFTFFTNRAYLHFDQMQDGPALADIASALAVRPSTDLEIVRMRSLLRLNLNDEAQAHGQMLLDTADERAMAPQHQQDITRLLGQAYFQAAAWEEALPYFDRALQLDETDLQAHYLRGLTHARLGDREAAKADLLVLQEHADHFPATSYGDLAYLLGDLKEFDDGLEWLDRSLAHYPYDVDTWQERGYQAMKGRRNKDARQSFAEAIRFYDEILPYVDDGETATDYREIRMSLKQEYTKLDKTWSVQVYGQRTDYDFRESDLPEGVRTESTEGALQSQGGISLGYRPPHIGFRNEKTFDVFARVLANFEPDSWWPDEDSYQGGVGLLYKPFIKHNYVFGFERLFKIGDNAEDNWLWRNTYGWEAGERPLRHEDLWIYRRLYAEASYYLEDPKRWVFFGQGHIGPSFFAHPNVIVTAPEALLVGRYQDNDPTGIGTYWYHGVGLNIRLLEGERALTRDRWALHAYAHYVWGRFDRAPEGLGVDDFTGWIIGASISK